MNPTNNYRYGWADGHRAGIVIGVTIGLSISAVIITALKMFT